MSDCAEVTTRKRLKTVAQTVLTGAGRVVLGVEEFALNADLYDTLKLSSSGPYLQIRRAKRVAFKDVPAVYEYEITARFYYGYAKSANEDFTAIENALFPLLDAWSKASNFDAGNGCNQPMDVELGDPQEDGARDPVVGVYEIRLRFNNAIV